MLTSLQIDPRAGIFGLGVGGGQQTGLWYSEFTIMTLSGGKIVGSRIQHQEKLTDAAGTDSVEQCLTDMGRKGMECPFAIKKSNLVDSLLRSPLCCLEHLPVNSASDPRE